MENFLDLPNLQEFKDDIISYIEHGEIREIGYFLDEKVDPNVIDQIKKIVQELRNLKKVRTAHIACLYCKYL